jgi:hypothetical protein
MFGLLAVGWVLFELANIWPFNADRITVLRLMFATGVIATVAVLSFGRSRLLPPVFLAGAFVSTTIYSQAVTTVAYVVGAAAITALVAALGWVRRPLFYVG